MLTASAINPAVQTLRRFIHLTFFVLVWFVLSLTIASPIGKPQNILLVFSESDAPKVLVQTDHGSASEMGAYAMDLPYTSPQIAVRHIARATQNRRAYILFNGPQ